MTTRPARSAAKRTATRSVEARTASSSRQAGTRKRPSSDDLGLPAALAGIISRRGAKPGAAKSVTVQQFAPKGKGSAVDVDPLRVKIAVVTDALGSNARTADFLGVARSQPGKWLAGQERPNPRARRLIQDLEYVWDRITDDRSSEAAHIWLRSANAFLRGATPLTWLKTRGPDDVIAAIDAEEAGSYA